MAFACRNHFQVYVGLLIYDLIFLGLKPRSDPDLEKNKLSKEVNI